MAIVRAIDENKKMEQMELTDEEFMLLKEQAATAEFSLEDMALILLTNGKTSRFKGTIEVIREDGD